MVAVAGLVVASGLAVQAVGRYARSVHAYQVPDVTLIDTGGHEVALAELLDQPGRQRPVLLQFVFTTCPSICPVLAASFRAVRRQLEATEHAVRMVSISIDPEHDTPERLAAYAEAFEAGDDWFFLTGRLADVTTVQKAFGAYHVNKMRHEPLILLRIAAGEPWVRFEGFLKPVELVDEVRRMTGS